MASFFSWPAAFWRAWVQRSPNSYTSLPIFTLKEVLSDFHSPQPSPVNGRGLGPKHDTRCTEATPFSAPGRAGSVLSSHRNARNTDFLLLPRSSHSFWLQLITSPSTLPHVRSHQEMQTGVEVCRGKKINTFFFCVICQWEIWSGFEMYLIESS